MTDYLSKSEVSALRSRLTRAERSGDPHRVREECLRAFTLFESRSYIDAWHRWNIALGDADRCIAYGRPYPVPAARARRGRR